MHKGERKIGLEVERWILDPSGHILKDLPVEIQAYHRNVREGFFHIDQNAAEIAFPPTTIEDLGEQLSTARNIIERELAPLGYGKTRHKHIHLNIDILPKEQARLVQRRRFFSPSQLLPVPDLEAIPPQIRSIYLMRFLSLEDTQLRSILARQLRQMGNREDMSKGAMLVKKTDSIVLHFQCNRYNLKGIYGLYKRIGSYLQSRVSRL